MTTITPEGTYSYERVARVAPTRDELAAYASRYYSPKLNITWTLGARDDHLVARRRKYVDSKLTPLFAETFSDWLPIMEYPTTYMVRFERDEHDTFTALRVSGTRVRHLRFIRL